MEPRLSEFGDFRFNRRPDPWFACQTLALKCQPEIVNARRFRNQRGRFLDLAEVRVAVGDGALRNAMRGEDDGDGRARFGIGAGACFLQLLLESSDEARVGVPALDKVHAELRQ